MSVPAGWYPDPSNSAQFRWWNGALWDDHAFDPRSAPSPLAAPPGERIDAEAKLLELRKLVIEAERELQTLRKQVVETRDTLILQEVGIYNYSHPLESAAAYRDRLDVIERSMAQISKDGHAVQSTKKWVINGSEKDGAKMVGDLSKLMLRAYNSEASTLVRSLKPYALKAAVERLVKSRDLIAKLGVSMKIAITDAYHQLRVDELALTADYLMKIAEEREKERENRARLKEEEAARREFEREQAKLEKERSHYEAALRGLQANGDTAAAQEAQCKLDEIQLALDGVARRAANVRAGYVYVISNIGSFGQRVVKIGMTRRLDPLDRVRELGDASVPFRFDVHAIIFSSDAVGLENSLHREFEHQRVNLVNAHREFFFTTPVEVENVLRKLDADLLTFTEDGEALEWHQSENLRNASVR